MIIKRTVCALLPVLLLFSLAACGGDTDKSSSSDPRFVKQEGQGMSEYDCYSYFDNARIPIAYALDYYCGSGLPYDADGVLEADEYGAVYAPVMNSLYADVASLESFLAMFYTGDFLSSIREKARMDEWVPRYKDIDGKLYVETSGDYYAMLYSFDMDTFSITENTVGKIVFTVGGKDSAGNKCDNTFTLIKANGSWRVSDWSITPQLSASSSQP